MSDEKDPEIDKFQMDVAKFSGNYLNYLIIAITPTNRLIWRSSDKTFAIGAAYRYLKCADEYDRISERAQSSEGKP